MTQGSGDGIQKYEAVYVNTTTSNTGTGRFMGTPENPVNNIDDALMIANDRNLGTIKVEEGTVTPTSSVNKNVIGSGYNSTTINLNGQLFEYYIENIAVYGDISGDSDVQLQECKVNIPINAVANDYYLSMEFKNCFISNDIGVTDAIENIVLINCKVEDTAKIRCGKLSVHGLAGSPKFTHTTETSAINEIHFDVGEVDIQPVASGDVTYNIYGNVLVNDNSGASVTVNDYSRPTALGHDGSSDLDTGLMAQLQDYVTDDTDSIYNRIGDFTSLSNKPSLLQVLGASGYDGDNSTIYDIQGNILMTLGDSSGYSNLTTILQVLGASSFDADNRTLFQNVVGSATSGTVTYGDVGGEQDIINKSPSTLRKVDSIWFDTTAMIQGGTVKLYYKIDGTNERLIDSWSLTASDEGSHIPQHTFSQDWRVTYEEDSDETADRNIPWRIEYGDDK